MATIRAELKNTLGRAPGKDKGVQGIGWRQKQVPAWGWQELPVKARQEAMNRWLIKCLCLVRQGHVYFPMGHMEPEEDSPVISNGSCPRGPCQGEKTPWKRAGVYCRKGRNEGKVSPESGNSAMQRATQAVPRSICLKMPLTLKPSLIEY